MNRHPVISADLATITASVPDLQRLGGKTVVVSGAAGFLPAYMVETLLYLNETGISSPVKVIGLVRNLDKARHRFAVYRDRNDLSLVEQDVVDPVALPGPVDYIVHAASQASPKYYGTDPVGTLRANTVGTMNLLELARVKQAAGFLFFSSGEVYGEVDRDKIPTREGDYGFVDPLQTRSCYAESKRMGENMCVCWAHQHGVPARIVRPFHTYGPGMSLDDGRVFADFVADIVAGRNIVMKSDGSAVRAFCYLADATAAFFKVLLDGETAQAYNVGNDQCEISVLGLAELLVGLFPDRALRVVKNESIKQDGYLKSPISRNCPNIERICGLGWRPSTGLKEGFMKTIRSFAP